MSGAWLAVLARVALAIGTPSSTIFGDGAIAGRVCLDLDGDGACGPDEPGAAGARVVMETGLLAVTDEQGRFHLAAVESRAADSDPAQLVRFGAGTHRVGLDLRDFPAGTRSSPSSATVEVPAGGMAWVELALRVPKGQLVAGIDPRPPGLRVSERGVEFDARLAAPDAVRVTVNGTSAELIGGVGGRWVVLPVGVSSVTYDVADAAGHVVLYTQLVDVVARSNGFMVIPRDLVEVGRIELPPPAGGVLQVTLLPGSRVFIDDVELALSSEGQGSRHEEGGRELKVRIELPRGPKWTELIPPREQRGVFVVGLLDGELGYDLANGPFAFVRGAASLRAAYGGFQLSADVDSRLQDFNPLRSAGWAALAPRRVDVFERPLENGVMPLTFSDTSATIASNAAQAPVRVELARPGLGKVGWGGYRLVQSEGELGRFHRALEGGYLEVASPKDGPFGGSVRAFATPSFEDPRGSLRRSPAHDRFEATGGSLFFLHHGDVVAGSDFVRVEYRDATGLPVGERHLLRGRDYAIDSIGGRVMLVEPLSFFVAPSLLTADPLSAGTSAVLTVDYEFVDAGASDFVAGGTASGTLGPVSARLSAFDVNRRTLTSGQVSVQWGGVRLSAEGARSAGHALEGPSLSDDGGLSFATLPGGATGSALTLRLRSSGLFNKGFVDASYRVRESDYSDDASSGFFRQTSVRVEQPIGGFVIAALYDRRDGADPRFPLEQRPFHALLAGGAVGYGQGPWSVRLEARGTDVRSDPTSSGEWSSGSRISVGVSGRFELMRGVTLVASHRQRLVSDGPGEGAFDDTFSSVGADVAVGKDTVVGLRGGWGPELGPQVWGRVATTRGDETWYGQQSLDVDSPSGGSRRLVTGVRKDLGAGTAVFVEDVASHDVDALRLGRAVAVSQKFGDALTVSARYERGVKQLVDVAPAQARDSGGLTASWEVGRARLWARGEGRVEQGLVPLTQWFGSAGGEVSVTDSFSGAARLLFTHTVRDGHLAARVVDATASASWRFASGLVIARYSYLQELSPVTPVERRLQIVSLLPTARLGSRVTIASGLHAGLAPEGVTVSGALRPTVRVWRDVDLALEGALRNNAVDAGGLSSARVEGGYRVNDSLRFAVGYTLFGFSGTGVNAGPTGSTQRVYLRVEAGL